MKFKTSEGTVIYGTPRHDCKFCVMPNKKNEGFAICKNPIINWLFEPKHNWLLGCPKPCTARKKLAETNDVATVKQYIAVMDDSGFIAFKIDDWNDFLDQLQYIKRWRESGKTPRQIPSPSMVNAFGVERYAVWVFNYCGWQVYRTPELSKKYYVVFENANTKG